MTWLFGNADSWTADTGGTNGDQLSPPTVDEAAGTMDGLIGDAEDTSTDGSGDDGKYNYVQFSLSGSAAQATYNIEYRNPAISGSTSELDRHNTIVDGQNSSGDQVTRIFAYAGDGQIYYYDGPASPGFQEWRDNSTSTGLSATSEHEIELHWNGSAWEIDIDDGAFTHTLQNNNVAINTLTVNGVAATDFHSARLEWDATDVTFGAPDNVAASTTEDDVTVTWDDSPKATEYRVYRHDAAGAHANGTQIATVSDDGSTSYSHTDADLVDGEQYFYQVTSYDGSTESGPSEEATATTDLPAPAFDAASSPDATTIDLSWTNNDDNPDGGYEVYRSSDGSLGSMLADITTPSTTSYSDGAASDPTVYHYTVRRYTPDAQTDSVQIEAGSSQLDVDDFELDSTVAGELTAQSISPTIDGGRHRIRWRRSADSSYPSGNEATIAHDASPHTYTITDLLDGEKYDVGIRFETDWTIGAWHTAQEITKLVSPSGLSTTNVGESSLDLSWTVNSDVDGSQQIWRDRADYDYQDPKGTLVATVGGSASTYSDAGLAPERDYTYTIRTVTQYVHADSDPLDATTVSVGARQTALPIAEWSAQVDHDGRTSRPSILDSPSRTPTIRDLARVELPVPRDDRWDDPQYRKAPMRVWENRSRLPIEQLDSVEHREGNGEARTVLTGVGGIDLRQRITTEVKSRETHALAADLVANNTDLTVNVDDPPSTASTDTVLEVDTESEWASALVDTDLSTIPIEVTSGGRLAAQQTCWTREAENFDGNNGTNFINGSEYSGTSGDDGLGGAQQLYSGGQWVEFDFTTGHDIPESAVDLEVRIMVESSAENPNAVDEITATIDGNEYAHWGTAGGADYDTGGSVEWAGGTRTWSAGALSAGSHTLRIEYTGSYGEMDVDVVAPHDGRYNLGFDNTVTTAPDGSNYLDSPRRYNDVTVTLDRLPFVLSITGAEIASSWDDTSNGQSLGVRNDSGDSFLTTSNSETLDKTFADLGAILDVQLTLSYHGTQTSTPATGINGQSVDSITVTGDFQSTPLTLDRSFDDTLLSILQTLASESNSVFGIGYDGDSETFEWTRIGQRSGDPIEATETYDVTTDYDFPERVTVYGGSEDIRQESLTADVGNAVDLANARLEERSEFVRSQSGTEYVRGDDYDVNWQDGTITALASGSISDGETVLVDYAYQPRATWTADNAAADPRFRRVNIPELSSEQACGLAAYRIIQEVSEPLKEATVRIPEDADAAVVQAVTTDALPNTGELEIRSTDGGPDGTDFTLGNRQRVRDVVQDIRSRLDTLSRMA